MASRGFGATLTTLALVALAAGGFYLYQVQEISAQENRATNVRTGHWAKETAPDFGANEEDADEFAIKDMFARRDFAAIENYTNDLRKNDGRTSSGYSRLQICYDTLDDLMEDMEQHNSMPAVKKFLAKWKSVAPESQTLRVASGRFFISAAWNARGGGYANTVREEQWKVFNDLLTESYEALSAARKAEPYDPEAAAAMLTLGMAAGMPKEKAKELLDECMEKYPTYEGVYERMSIYLLPRWAGNPGDIAACMKYVQKKLPKPLGDVMFARMAHSVADYTNHNLFPETGLKYEELKPAIETLVATYPDGLSNKRSFTKLVARGDDLKLAQKLYEETSGTWSAARMKITWGNEAAFSEFKDWVAGKGDNPAFITPLEVAIENDDYLAVKDAIAAGADVNRKLSGGSRPLISAISDGHKEIAKLLLEHGADVNLNARNGYTVAAATTDKDNVEMLQQLLDKGFKISDPVNRAGWKIQHMAAYHNAHKCMELILKQPGVKVDEPLSNGSTALFLAAEKNSLECAKLLLDAGANVNAKDSHLITALHHAALKGSAETIKLLLERGADPKAASDCNITALDTAERNHQKEAADLLRVAMKS